MVNALQAVLDKAKEQAAPEKPRKAATAAIARAKPAKASPPAEASAEARPSKSSRPVREGKRFVGAHFHPEVARQLKMLAAEDGTTIQELLEQAVDLLFVKAGKSKIDQLTRRG